MPPLHLVGDDITNCLSRAVVSVHLLPDLLVGADAATWDGVNRRGIFFRSKSPSLRLAAAEQATPGEAFLRGCGAPCFHVRSQLFALAL